MTPIEGMQCRALTLTPLGEAALVVPQTLFDAGYTVIGLCPVIEEGAEK